MNRCVKCGSPDLFEIDLTVVEGPAHFTHCRACEHRYWAEPDGSTALELSQLLAG
ncbi:MAG TPA: hypothetical protein VM324_10995 [Egibacteraceae bacterium]|jgi:uncharacterized protein (DUF983 family)|nr:hypothetical protein [Egibacteraceae bacterium]